MQSVYVSLPNPEAVQAFVEQITMLDGEFELISGNYILDARSLMGIFSLDLTKPLQLRVYNDSPANMAALQRFEAHNNATQGEGRNTVGQ